ncbi:alpha/beta fold hydrolase [bacterium]|nr:alpha/beta fold hydrolase [bacterium]
MLVISRKAFLAGLGAAAAAAAMPSFAQEAATTSARPIEEQPAFKHHHERLNGRQQHFVTAGAGKAVLFLHGFPDLWRTWRAQMRAVVDAGYMAIAPDLRGFGETEGVADPQSYTSVDVMGDLIAILDHLGVAQVTVVAHDWGTNAGWAAVQLRPDRFVGIMAVSVPWLPHGDRSLPQILREEAPAEYYLPWFLTEGPPDAEFNADPETFLRRIFFTNSAERSGDAPPAMLTIGGSLIVGLEEPPGEMRFLPNDELAIYVEAFRKSGATSAFNAYRSLHRSWELMAAWSDFVPAVPARTIVGDKDLVVGMPGMRDVFAAQHDWLPQGQPTIWIGNCGHFAQMEQPDEVSRHVVDFVRETRG